MIPPSAGEITASHSILRSLSASCPQTARGDLGVLEEERALEKLPAVQARAEHEMSVEQRTGFAKKRQQIFAHFPCGIGETNRKCR